MKEKREKGGKERKKGRKERKKERVSENLQGGCLYSVNLRQAVMIERTELFTSFINQIKGKLVRNNMLKTRTKKL